MDNETKKNFDAGQQAMDQPSLEMEIVGPKETDRYRLPQVNNEGIQAKIGRLKEGEMVYELQVPLKKTTGHPNAIEPKDNFIGLGFETSAITDHTGNRSGEHSGSPGEFGGSGSQPEGGMGKGHRGGGRSHQGGATKSGGISEPLKMWWKVKL